LKGEFDGGFRDEAVVARADDASNADGIGDKRGCTQFRDLLADFVVGEPRSAAAGRTECSDQNQLKGTIHQGFESSMLW
jgi:hypothetical protein